MKRRNLIALIAFLLAASVAQAGAWGYKSFENDDALDWVVNVLKPAGRRGVDQTITSVAKGHGYLEVPDACSAIAACEVLAAIEGRPSPDIPKDVAAIAKKLSSDVDASIRHHARDALDRILNGSELNELWKETNDDFEKWRKTVEDLKARI